MIKKYLKSNNAIFYIIKNIQILGNKLINKLINLSNIHYKLEKIENALKEIDNQKELEWEKFCLNGQIYRKKIITKLLNKIKFDSLIETGTEYGFSTIFFSQFVKKIISIEKSKSLHYIAKIRLKNFKNINLVLEDSKNLKNILSKININKNEKNFFYLDAHSENDYPLLDELEFIDKNYKNSLVVIDDFQIPNDDGYGYDSFNGRKLNINLISKRISNDASFYFPKILSSLETGRLRGYVLISRNESIKTELDLIDELYLYKN